MVLMVQILFNCGKKSVLHGHDGGSEHILRRIALLVWRKLPVDTWGPKRAASKNTTTAPLLSM